MENNSKEKEALMLAIYKDAARPAFQVVGRTLQAILAPIRGVLWSAEKIEKYVNERLERWVKGISEEKIIAPAPEIVYPLLQDLVYLGEKENLREMYLNLLVNSMDADKEKIVHSAYVQIIKQLSPLDAQILAEFRPKTPILNENAQTIGYEISLIVKQIVAYVIIDKNSNINGYRMFLNNVLETATTVDIRSISVAAVNLSRLGLIEIDFDKFVVRNNDNDVVAYKQFLEPPLLPSSQYNIDGDFDIKKGVAQLTEFGFNFMSACVIEEEFVEK
ncbi:MAG: DUF4393 domain-containing protein [Defluviitaleaceae bacterium]|nr:DUF4393 domain-containing protein [Defluviitaleaceae bacterium]